MLVLAAMCGATAAQAQRYFIPKYKKKKEVRDYDLSNSERRWTVTFGGGYNMALGMRNRIRFSDRDYTVRYYEDPSLSGGAVNLGVGYKFTDNIVAGLEAGYLFQDNDDAIPIYGTFNYYYGPSTSTRRHRWFNYARGRWRARAARQVDEGGFPHRLPAQYASSQYRGRRQLRPARFGRELQTIHPRIGIGSEYRAVLTASAISRLKGCPVGTALDFCDSFRKEGG